MTKPDDDYENPIGEVLDADTVADLAAADLVKKLAEAVGQ